MPILTREQIAYQAKGAGFTGSDIDIAVAVALAESGGDTKSHNTKPPDNSYGLWQINMYKDLGPQRRKWFGIDSNDALFDPTMNAKAAYMVYKNSGWKAWTTYTSGKYKEFLRGGEGGSNTVTTEVGTTVDSGGTGITGAISAVGTSLFKGLTNAVWIIVAITVMVVGAVILLREPLGKVVPAGKIAKVIK